MALISWQLFGIHFLSVLLLSSRYLGLRYSFFTSLGVHLLCWCLLRFDLISVATQVVAGPLQGAIRLRRQRLSEFV